MDINALIKKKLIYIYKAFKYLNLDYGFFVARNILRQISDINLFFSSVELILFFKLAVTGLVLNVRMTVATLIIT